MRQHTQARSDSFMEAVTNTAIGFVISMVTWQVVAFGFGIPMPITKNLEITGIFTVVSIARQYVLRRCFDGRTPWAALKAAVSGSATGGSAPYCYGSKPGPQQQAENDCGRCWWQGGCIGTLRSYRGRRP